MTFSSSMIAPSARIDSSADLAAGAVVGHEAIVGPDCRLHPYSIVGPFTTLGPACEIHPFAVVGGPAQAMGIDPGAEFRLECGARNVFREGTTVSRGTDRGAGITRLGAGNLMMAHSHLGHDSRIGDDNVISNGVSLAGHVTVGDGVTFGGHAGVHQYVRVGDLALVAANAMVSQDVPPYCIVAGDRARLIGLNTTGLRRAGIEPEARARLKRAVRAIFRAARRVDAARALLDDPYPCVARLAQFVVSSRRGLVRWR